MHESVIAQPGASSPHVTVVVVNRDRAELLRACLTSLLAQSLPPLEILVVDNASQDNSISVCGQFRDRRIRVLEQNTNLGFAAGNNVAIREAKGEFTALLNNDAEAEPQWLSQLVSPLLEDPSVAMAASKILLADKGYIDKVGHLIFADGQNRGRGTGEIDEGQYDRSEETLFPDGCAALYRTEVLRQVGGFDERFFAYAEDADLGLRIRLLGWRCVYVPGAVAHHHHSSTLGAYSLEKIYWVERNRLWVAVKTFPSLLLILNPLLTLYRWSWNGLAALLGQGPGGRAAKEGSALRVLATVLRATWDGLCGLPECFRARRKLRAQSRLTDSEFLRLLWRFRIRARELAFGAKERTKR